MLEIAVLRLRSDHKSLALLAMTNQLRVALFGSPRLLRFRPEGEPPDSMRLRQPPDRST